MKKPSNVNEYIAAFPESTQKQLEEIRAIIRKAAPKAEEVISYGMPGYKVHGLLVWFAGYAKHIGFYPSGSGIEAFKDVLGGYTFSKGAVQFPLGKPLPKKLITEMVKFRVYFDNEIAEVKKAAKAAKSANTTSRVAKKTTIVGTTPKASAGKSAPKASTGKAKKNTVAGKAAKAAVKTKAVAKRKTGNK
jgi:uncharacterized protein YdhG (YjbR/CyaY superfamily)